jgi:hypothetical protein
VKLNKWIPLHTRFRIEKSRIHDADYGSDHEQYRLVIEFPLKYRTGYFPFELQLRRGNTRGLDNYWANPFGVAEIKRVIEALELLTSNRALSVAMPMLRRTRFKAEAHQIREHLQSRKISPKAK